MGERTPSDRPVSRRRWRWLLVPLALSLVVPVLFFWPAYRNRQAAREEARQRLVAAVAEAERLDGAWRLEDLKGYREPLPDAGDATPTLEAITSKLPSRWPAWAHYRPQAVVGSPQERGNADPRPGESSPPALSPGTLADLLPPVLLAPEQLAELRTEMSRAADALSLAHQITEPPHRHLPLTPSKNLNATRTQGPSLGAAPGLLSHSVMLRAQQGEGESALQSCQAYLSLIHIIGDMPTPAAQQARQRIRFGTARQLEHILALCAPPPSTLASFQANLAEAAEIPCDLIGERGYRALADSFCEALQKGEVSASGWITSNGPPKPGMINSWSHRMQNLAYDEHREIIHGRAVLLERMNQVVEILKLPPEERDDATVALRTAHQEDPLLVRRLFSLSWALGNRNELAKVRSAVTALAAERYRQKGGHWPKTLANLVPDFLSAVPTDPFTGTPLQYRHLEDGVVIYSVGEDRKDGKGVLKRQGVLKDPDDVGFQLWDHEKRRQTATRSDRTSGD